MSGKPIKEPINQELREWIALRVQKLRGKTPVARFAQESGVSAGTISSTQNAGQQIGVEYLDAILRVRNLTLGQFFSPRDTLEQRAKNEQIRILHEMIDFAVLDESNIRTLTDLLKPYVQLSEEGKIRKKRGPSKTSSDRKSH